MEPNISIMLLAFRDPSGVCCPSRCHPRKVAPVRDRRAQVALTNTTPPQSLAPQPQPVLWQSFSEGGSGSGSAASCCLPTPSPRPPTPVLKCPFSGPFVERLREIRLGRNPSPPFSMEGSLEQIDAGSRTRIGLLYFEGGDPDSLGRQPRYAEPGLVECREVNFRTNPHYGGR